MAPPVFFWQPGRAGAGAAKKSRRNGPTRARRGSGSSVASLAVEIYYRSTSFANQRIFDFFFAAYALRGLDSLLCLAWRLACVVVGHQNVFGIAIGNNDIALHELCHSILFDRVELICYLYGVYPRAAFKVFMYVGVTIHTSYHRCSLSGCCFALIPCLVTAPVGHMGY